MGGFTNLEVRRMYKVTIRCWDIKPEELARELDARTRRFKVWIYDKTAYASVEMKDLAELGDLKQKLTKSEFGVDCIKVDKADGFD